MSGMDAARRAGFRYFSAYFLLYIFLQGWRAPAVWVAQRFFDIRITVFPAGSGDTTFNYVQVLCFAVAAAMIAAIWTLADRRRDYATLHEWVRLLLRYTLAGAMLGYGMVKVVQLQFPPVDPDRLLQTYGETSPMRLLWTFMGYSKLYNLFAGLGEVIGGVLLFARRTTTLGALIVAAVMSNVVALNFSYDVPVKLFSMHLLAMAIFLILPDTRRLFDLLVRNRATVPGTRPDLFTRPRWRLAANAVKAVVICAMLGGSVWTTRSRYQEETAKPLPPLHGVWEVREFERDGKIYQYPEAHHLMWKRLAVNRYYARLITLGGSSFRYQISLAGDRIAFKQFGENESEQSLKLVRDGDKAIEISGMFDGERLRVKLTAEPLDRFLLLGRGFHWINEYPLNR